MLAVGSARRAASAATNTIHAARKRRRRRDGRAATFSSLELFTAVARGSAARRAPLLRVLRALQARAAFLAARERIEVQQVLTASAQPVASAHARRGLDLAERDPIVLDQPR